MVLAAQVPDSASGRPAAHRRCTIEPTMKTKHLTAAFALLIALLGVAAMLDAADVTAAAWPAPSLR